MVKETARREKRWRIEGKWFQIEERGMARNSSKKKIYLPNEILIVFLAAFAEYQMLWYRNLKIFLIIVKMYFGMSIRKHYQLLQNQIKIMLRVSTSIYATCTCI